MGKQITVSIGVFCHNEENNVGNTLKSLLVSKTDMVKIKEILVVSSGSFDKTNRIIRSYCKKDRRVKLIEEAERRGKSAAINLFLRLAKGKIIVSLSGDVRVRMDAIEEIVIPFINPDVGMVGAHPLPTNCRFSKVGKEMELLWELHHQVSLSKPKCGEMVAFRNVIRGIPQRSAVDEATLEVLLKMIGFSVVYAPRAIVYNKAPLTLGGFLLQRRRVHAGHLWLVDRYQYRVSTMHNQYVLSVLFDYVTHNPNKFWIITRLLIYESIGQLLGWFDYAVLGKNPYVWGMVKR